MRRDDVSAAAHCQITADTLNRHYASVFTDSNRAPLTKQTTDLRDDQFLTETEVFMQLDKLHHTATGLDQVPACMASVTGCCRFRQTNRKAVQRIAGQISRAIAVKEGLDLSCPKRQRILQTTVISGRSPSHQYLFELAYGTHGCQEIPLSSI